MINFDQELSRISYKIITNQSTTGWFNFGFMNTGAEYPYIYIYGESGKLYDQEDNYFGSYLDDEKIIISGNIFSGHHNYFYKGDLIHDTCTRRDHGSGINAFVQNNLTTGYGITLRGSDSY